MLPKTCLTLLASACVVYKHGELDLLWQTLNLETEKIVCNLTWCNFHIAYHFAKATSFLLSLINFVQSFLFYILYPSPLLLFYSCWFPWLLFYILYPSTLLLFYSCWFPWLLFYILYPSTLLLFYSCWFPWLLFFPCFSSFVSPFHVVLLHS